MLRTYLETADRAEFALSMRIFRSHLGIELVTIEGHCRRRKQEITRSSVNKSSLSSRTVRVISKSAKDTVG
jgi:hypothetical protein